MSADRSLTVAALIFGVSYTLQDEKRFRPTGTVYRSPRAIGSMNALYRGIISDTLPDEPELSCST